MLHKVKLVIALALVPIALFAFCFPSLAQASWTTHEVLSGTKSSIFHSIAVHKNGTIYIAFENGPPDTIFITSSANGTDWANATVAASSQGTGLSLALNSTGTPHISYGVDNATKFAFQNTTGWDQKAIDPEDPFTASTSIEFDSQDQPHVSYLKGTDPLKIRYAKRNETGHWRIEDAVSDSTIDKFFTSMTLDSDDKPHIVYLINEHLYYSTRNNSSWTNEELVDETSTFQRNDIALDQTDEVHISYFDNTNAELRYTRLSENVSYVIDINPNAATPIGKYNSIEVDSDNNPHIAYSGKNGTSLKYAYHNGTDWKGWTVDSNATGKLSVSLVLDNADNPHISYLAANNTLKYATNENFSSGASVIQTEEVQLGSESNPTNDNGGGGGGGGGCLMTPESSFGAGWLLLLIVPAFALINRRVRS
jgi:hypothetical protein